MLIASAVLTLVGLCAQPLPAGLDPAAARLLESLGRDAKVVVLAPDGPGALRRLRRVPATSVFQRIAADELKDALADAATQMAVFLPRDVVDAAPGLLERARGGVALAMEGFVLEGGVPRPDLLLVADIDGFEGVVPALLASARGDADAPRRLAAASLPFALGPARPNVVTARGVPIVDLVTASGQRVAIAESAGRLFAARAPDRLMRALFRLGVSGRESILDSVRFRDALDQVGVRPGDVIWYADLRRLRLDDAFAMAAPGMIRDLMAEQLAAYDGMAVAARGVGEAFHVRAFVERGGLGPPRGAARSAPFRYPASLSTPVSGVFARHVDPAGAGEALLGLARLVAPNRSLESTVTELLAPLGGERYLAALRSRVGTELALFQPEGAFPGESLLRAGFALELRDDAAVSAWFDRLVDVGAVRATTLAGGRAWEVSVAPALSFLPAFAVRDGWLVGANHVIALRRILERLGAAPRLADDDGFHAPFDRLDLDPARPGLVSGYVDSARLARSLATWLGGVHGIMLVAGLRDDAEDLVGEVVGLLDDPEFQDVLRGAAFHVRETPGGYLLDCIGP